MRSPKACASVFRHPWLVRRDYALDVLPLSKTSHPLGLTPICIIPIDNMGRVLLKVCTAL